MDRRSARKLWGISIVEALSEPALLGSALVGNQETWVPWLTALRALFGLPLSPDQTDLYRACTGRTQAPTTPSQTSYWVIGRGGGKSFMLSLVGVYLACFRDWSSRLAPGGKPVVMLLSPSREQSKINLGYIVGILEQSPILRKFITNLTANSVELITGVTVETGVPDFRSIRGRSVCCGIIDECAFLRTADSASPDYEVVTSLMPALGRFGSDSMLLIASTPYSQRGVLYDGYRDNFGRDDGAAFCWQAPTITMNPSFDRDLIARELSKDPAKNGAEYLAEFRSDIAGFLSREELDGCVTVGCFERYPTPDVKYFGFADMSGGGPDEHTLAIAHRKEDRIILDAIRARRGSPEAAVAEFSELVKSYGISRIKGDNYAKAWPQEAYKRHGLHYERCEQVRSDIYLAVAPLIRSGRVEFLDHPKMLLQFATLERKTSPSGRDQVNHPPAGHDDICNAVSGALVSAATAIEIPKIPFVAPFVFSGGRHNPFGPVGPNPFSDISANSDFERVDNDKRASGFSIKYY